MIKVISENQVVASYAVYNKVNSIEELVALTKVNNVHFEAFASEDIVKGNDLHELGTANLRVEDFCIEEGIDFENYDTIDQDTEKVSMWFIHCNKNGFTPFWFVGFCGNGYEIDSCKRTTLKSDLSVAQEVWFAHGDEFFKGYIVKVCLSSPTHCGKYPGERVEDEFSFLLASALVSNGYYFEYDRPAFQYLDKCKDGFVIIRCDNASDSYLRTKNRDLETKYFIRPIDKVFTKSPF